MIFHLYLHDLRWLCDFSSMCFHLGVRKHLFFLLCWILKEGNKKENTCLKCTMSFFSVCESWKFSQEFLSSILLQTMWGSYCPDLCSGRNQNWVNFSNLLKATQLAKGIAGCTWTFLMAKPLVFPTFHAHIRLSLAPGWEGGGRKDWWWHAQQWLEPPAEHSPPLTSYHSSHKLFRSLSNIY